MIQLLTPKQAAEIIGTAVTTLQKWRCEGYGPAFIKLRGSIRYDPQDVEAWLQKQRSYSDQWGA